MHKSQSSVYLAKIDHIKTDVHYKQQSNNCLLC